MTGLYPVRYGLQDSTLPPASRHSLPLNITLLPEHLGNIGYKSHIVGKWHLGCSSWNHTPTSRGFDSHVGYLNHGQRYSAHTVTYKGHCGYDFWFNQEVLESASGVYSMDIFLSRATTVIRDHDISQPLFLFLSMQAPHIGTEDHMFEAPQENIAKFDYIGMPERAAYAGMLDTLDQATGVVLEALYENGMLENCLIVFSSDNGADIAGGGSNWPLRGVKQTLWEGGVRLPAFVWSPLLGARGRVSWDLMHFVDWLPTLYHMAGGNTDDLGPIDGVSQWETLSTGAPSKRQELLLGFNVLNSAGAYRSGRYKLVVSPSDGSWDEFREEPPGNVSLAIDLDQLMADSAVAQTLAKFYNTGTPPAAKPEWRQYASICCGSELGSNFRTADSPYLFDVVSDPCETKNLASERSDLVATMREKLFAVASITVPAAEDILEPDSTPECNNCVWGPREASSCDEPLTCCCGDTPGGQNTSTGSPCPVSMFNAARDHRTAFLWVSVLCGAACILWR
ncbi:arylsulfatase B-like isoform X2 [Haemaphysalis longicornis]